MVHMFIVNPARKFRLLSNVVLKSSSRLLKQTGFESHASASSITDVYVPDTRPQKMNKSYLSQKKLPEVPPGSLQRDPQYYTSESDSGCCVFRAENTLFRVSIPAMLAFVRADFICRSTNAISSENPAHLGIFLVCPVFRDVLQKVVRTMRQCHCRIQLKNSGTYFGRYTHCRSPMHLASLSTT